MAAATVVSFFSGSLVCGNVKRWEIGCVGIRRRSETLDRILNSDTRPWPGDWPRLDSGLEGCGLCLGLSPCFVLSK